MKHLFSTALLILMPGILIGRPLNVSVSSPSAILINAENGKILFAKNIDDAHPPGSVTKIATCLLALERIKNFDEEVRSPLECLIKITHKVKKERKYQDPPYLLEPDGTSYGIYTGEVLSIKDLLYGLILPSGNDAANVLAYHLSHGDIPAYMEDVNQYLRSIGCRNTKFYNPHGLHHPSHLTTARDLALIGKEAIKHPMFLDIMKAVQYERPKTNKQVARTVWNHNLLLRKGKYYYPKAFGIKTGYHAAAGHVFVGAAKDEHRTLVGVVMHAATRDEKFKDITKMFDAAFGEQQLTRQLLNHQEKIFKTQIKGSRQALQAGLREDLYMQYFPSEEEEVEPCLIWYDIQLPIKQGNIVGELQVKTSEGIVVKTASIYALNDIQIALWKRGLKWLISWRGAGVIIAVVGLFMSICVSLLHRKKLAIRQSG